LSESVTPDKPGRLAFAQESSARSSSAETPASDAQQRSDLASRWLLLAELSGSQVEATHFEEWRVPRSLTQRVADHVMRQAEAEAISLPLLALGVVRNGNSDVQ
jgi:hypothetical protein